MEYPTGWGQCGWGDAWPSLGRGRTSLVRARMRHQSDRVSRPPGGEPPNAFPSEHS